VQTLLRDTVLTDDWHPVAFSSAIVEGSLVSARVLGEDIVVWRWEGVVKAWKDLCLHRGSKL